MPCTVVRGGPLLNLDSEDVIVELWLQLAERRPKLRDDIGVKRQPAPMLPFPVHTHAATHDVKISPAAADDF